MNAIGILSTYQGYGMYDAWKSYFKNNARHCLYNAHHLGRLVFLLERYPQKWVKPMIDDLINIKETIEQVKEEKANGLIDEQLDDFSDELNRLAAEGLKANPE